MRSSTIYSAMEAQESCGRTWQFRIFLGFFLAVTVNTSPFLHGPHSRTFHHLPPCKDHDGVQPIGTIYNLQNISLAYGSQRNKKFTVVEHHRSIADDLLRGFEEITTTTTTIYKEMYPHHRSGDVTFH
ncbi:hypothetical protein SADUNF_Sadunf18G0099300 [Salix dunnii]|uniref:Uncharacterized protein n=1 Tax=Salix dunnii TaxID=1413687 RepID=A0A835MGL7_9ROSI|nr:hypothetical protein SADUNF_Sadunf18G0099300 [Salix dunnii]